MYQNYRRNLPNWGDLFVYLCMANKELTTALAFEALLNRPDQWRQTGRPMQQRLNFLDKLKNGTNVTLDTKEKILKEAGYSEKQVTLWNEP